MTILTVLLTIGKIAAAILVFGIIIMVHELGHFFVAKLMGVKVNEFAIGMGPKLLKFGKKETTYSLRLFPIGGFCAMEGEDEDSPDRRAFGQKKVWRRVLIVIAGATMNLILGLILLVAYFGIYTHPDSSGTARFTSTVIAELPETASSYTTGLRVGDEIIKVDGKIAVTSFDVAYLMQSSENGEMDLTVKRTIDGKRQTLLLENVQFEHKVNDTTGAQTIICDFKVLGIKKTVLSTVAQAGKMEVSVGMLVWNSLGDLISGKYGLNELSGPVGTVDAIGDAVVQAKSDGLESLMMLVVMITVNVGIFNLLPLPALDGGRLIFLIFEAIFRKPVPAKYEGMVHAVGLILLFGLMLIVTFSDIMKLIFPA